jgi:hypothetical protein
MSVTYGVANMQSAKKSVANVCKSPIASLGSRVQIEALMASQEYAELKANCPLALVELWEKICSLGSRSKSSFHFGSSLA